MCSKRKASAQGLRNLRASNRFERAGISKSVTGIVIGFLVVCQLAGCSTQERASTGVTGSRPFQSWQTQRFRNVVRQQYEFTCGAASLSIISKYYLGRPISEQEFAKAIKNRHGGSDWQEKELMGFSLLDMKSAADSFGFKAEGVKMTIEDALSLRGPIIIHLEKASDRHFAVLRGISGDRAYVSDPIFGNVRVPLYQLQQEWRGYALAIWLEDEVLPLDHKLLIKSTDIANPLTAARRSLYVTPPPAIPYRL